MSPALAFLGVSILGTWGLASIGMIAGGIIMIFFPGDADTASNNVLGGSVLLAAGIISGGIMQVVVAPLLGLDPPIPVPARKIKPHTAMQRWARAGALRDFPDGTPKEVRLRSQRILIIRQGDQAHAMSGLCSHARLPLGGFPGSPLKPYTVRDNCVTCPFHGARFDVDSGHVVRQAFDSQFNNAHPFLGGFQKKIFRVLSAPPAPPGMPKPSMKAEDIQTYPVRVENGEIIVGLPR